MSDEFTTNENGSKTPEETNFQDYAAPENEIVQNETSQMTQEQPHALVITRLVIRNLPSGRLITPSTVR